MLEYKSGTFSNIWLTAGTEPDQNQMDVAIENIKKGELLIHDLGYFSQDGIMTIKGKEAFFLSRYYPQTALYKKTKNGEWQRFDLLKALLNNDERTAKEFWVRYGSKAKVSCRLIAKRVFCQIYGRLIVLVLTLFLCGKFRKRMWEQKRYVGTKAKRIKFLKMFSSFANLCAIFLDLLDEQRCPYRATD